MPKQRGEDAFGRTLAERMVETNPRSPLRVAVVELPDGKRKLEVRRMYWKSGALKYGSGIRLRLGDVLGDTRMEFAHVMDAVQAVLEEATGDANDHWTGFPEPWPDDGRRQEGYHD